jgi:ABC-type proline/glycine betaine transport system permease subunit
MTVSPSVLLALLVAAVVAVFVGIYLHRRRNP